MPSTIPPTRCAGGGGGSFTSSTPKGSTRTRGSPFLADDLDRRPERNAVAQELDAVIVHPNAPVGDSLPEEPRPRRSVHPDDASARPVGELRVGAGLERVRAEDR